MGKMKRWKSDGFAGIPLVDTLSKLIQIGEIKEADNLRTQMKIADKRYWRIKVRALSDSGNISELSLFAANRTSPIGYELFIEAFLKHGRNDLAQPFVPRVKDPEKQAIYYSKMGMEEEAAAARAQQQKQGGAGRLLQGIFGRG